MIDIPLKKSEICVFFYVMKTYGFFNKWMILKIA